MESEEMSFGGRYCTVAESTRSGSARKDIRYPTTFCVTCPMKMLHVYQSKVFLMSLPSPKFAESRSEKLKCFQAMQQLRPHIKTKEDFLERVERMERTNSYHLLYISIEDEVVA